MNIPICWFLSLEENQKIQKQINDLPPKFKKSAIDLIEKRNKAFFSNFSKQNLKLLKNKLHKLKQEKNER